MNTFTEIDVAGIKNAATPAEDEAIVLAENAKNVAFETAEQIRADIRSRVSEHLVVLAGLAAPGVKFSVSTERDYNARGERYEILFGAEGGWRSGVDVDYEDGKVKLQLPGFGSIGAENAREVALAAVFGFLAAHLGSLQAWFDALPFAELKDARDLAYRARHAYDRALYAVSERMTRERHNSVTRRTAVGTKLLVRTTVGLGRAPSYANATIVKVTGKCVYVVDERHDATTRLSWETYLSNHDERIYVFADDEQPNA